ncbi:MAG TPA: substrate-binding domain-containing protein, partial [Streptosporangiaceae bacterium]|nr:substrate-binding domain-containing protein [Streptosporangiaceae bacterium]
HFRRLARELGLQPVIMRSPLTITDVRKAAGTLLARPDAPTAIITNSDYTALGIYKTARDLSLRIGPDVSIIGHDDLATSELLDPPLATIRLDGREMGRALMARLLGDGRGDYVAPVELVERQSLQAPRLPVNPLFTPLSAATR